MLVERAADGLDRARGDLVALRDQLGELADDRRGRVDGGGLAVEREHVAAQVDLAVEMPLERSQHRVLAAGQLGGDGIVKLDRPAHYPSAFRTRSDARLPSARPPAVAITAFITAPMSLDPLAPVCAIAAATISSSWASSSSVGR